MISPCKYCGKQPIHKCDRMDDKENSYYQTQDYYFVKCWHYEDENNLFMGDTAEQALKKWNKYQSVPAKIEVKKVEQKGQLSLF